MSNYNVVDRFKAHRSVHIHDGDDDDERPLTLLDLLCLSSVDFLCSLSTTAGFTSASTSFFSPFSSSWNLQPPFPVRLTRGASVIGDGESVDSFC